MNILQINGSARSEAGNSTRIASDIVARLQAANPGAALVQRDLARDPAPVIDEAALGALFTPAEQRTPEQSARVAASDALVAEVQAADVLVIGVPMYNFGISTQLKNWIDAIARAGVTFRYTAAGAEGLVKGKQVLVFAARGGLYQGQPHDTQTPYVRNFLGFLGMTDVRFVFAEGLAMGEEPRREGLRAAEADIDALLDTAEA